MINTTSSKLIKQIEPSLIYKGIVKIVFKKVPEVRRENMRMVAHLLGAAAELARKTGLEPSQISQIIGATQHRNIGNVLARSTEAKLNLPSGMLDQPNLSPNDFAAYIGINPAYKASQQQEKYGEKMGYLQNCTLQEIELLSFYRESNQAGQELAVRVIREISQTHGNDIAKSAKRASDKINYKEDG